jgi:hypothetical protein
MENLFAVNVVLAGIKTARPAVGIPVANADDAVHFLTEGQQKCDNP